MRRRQLLATVGTLTAGTVGCVGRPGDLGKTPTSEPPPRITETSFTARDGECGLDTDVARVTVDGDIVRVDGRLLTPTPCHGAVLADATLVSGGDRLVVAVQTTDSPPDVCVQCVGELPYEALVRIAGGQPATVQVDHDGETVTTVTTVDR